jgi:hypothetical protein
LVVWNMNFMFPYIGNNNPNWRTHIFQRGRHTTNQLVVYFFFMDSMVIYTESWEVSIQLLAGELGTLLWMMVIIGKWWLNGERKIGILIFISWEHDLIISYFIPWSMEAETSQKSLVNIRKYLKWIETKDIYSKHS